MLLAFASTWLALTTCFFMLYNRDRQVLIAMPRCRDGQSTDLRLPICQNAVPKKRAISNVNTNRMELYSARAQARSASTYVPWRRACAWAPGKQSIIT